MRPSKRKPVNKRKSARKFRKHSTRTKAKNIIMGQRGGIRL